jgi:hypothetical protein
MKIRYTNKYAINLQENVFLFAFRQTFRRFPSNAEIFVLKRLVSSSGKHIGVVSQNHRLQLFEMRKVVKNTLYEFYNYIIYNYKI